MRTVAVGAAVNSPPAAASLRAQFVMLAGSPCWSLTVTVQIRFDGPGLHFLCLVSIAVRARPLALLVIVIVIRFSGDQQQSVSELRNGTKVPAAPTKYETSAAYLLQL